MAVKEANDVITLSVIVPIGGFPNGDLALRSWISNKLPQGMEVILVLDTEDEFIGNSILSIVERNSISRISVLFSQSRNPGSTREVGLRAASGKWVCFWDSDDLPEVSTVWNYVESENNQKFDIIVGAYRTVEFNSKKIANHLHGARDPLMDLYLNPGLWRSIFKRSILENISFPSLKMGEDQVFLFHSLVMSKEIKFVNDIFYNYYQYPTGQLTKMKNISSDLMAARNFCTEIYSKHPNQHLLSAIIRQNLTLLKRGTGKIRLMALRDLVYFNLGSRSNLKLFFRVLTKI